MVQTGRVVNPEVKIYDVGCGTGMLLVMLYLAGIPYEALVGVDLPRGIRDASEPRYWKVIENRNYEVSKDDILLISFGEQLNHAAKRYVAYGGDKVILIGSKSGSGCFQQPPVDIFQGRPEWSVESHMLPVNEVHGKYHNYITYNTR